MWLGCAPLAVTPAHGPGDFAVVTIPLVEFVPNSTVRIARGPRNGVVVTGQSAFDEVIGFACLTGAEPQFRILVDARPVQRGVPSFVVLALNAEERRRAVLHSKPRTAMCGG